MSENVIGELKKKRRASYVVYEVDVNCPHCKHFSSAEAVFLEKGYIAITCYKCKEGILVKSNATNQADIISSDLVEEYYPKHKIVIDPLIPNDIGNDYFEAQQCYSVGAWQGCSVMARRCMHLVVKHFDAQGKDLYQQIEDLHKKQLITLPLSEMAQRVRVLGKHGAHPYDFKGEPLSDLDDEDAKAALEFCEFIFDQLFIQPEKIKLSKAKKP